MRLAGIVMGHASDAIIERGRKIAAHMLEAAPADIAFARDAFRDLLAIRAGHWDFDPEQVTGIAIGPVPVEELLFFVAIPICAILTLEAVRSVKGWTVLDSGAIHRTFEFANYKLAYEWMGRLFAYAYVSVTTQDVTPALSRRYGLGARRGADAGPGVVAKVMMVAAGRQKRGLRAEPGERGGTARKTGRSAEVVA